MRRSGPALLALTLFMPPAFAEDRSRLADALALQEAFQQVIEKAEPAIACVLVSRSDFYAKHGFPPGTDGRLGKFEVRGPRLDDTKKDRYIRGHDLSDPQSVPELYGSGVVVDEAGLVLTMAHVVRGATKVYVRLPGGKGSWADVHAADPRSDLAILKLIDRVPGLKPLPWGDADKLKKGQFVLAMANPFAAGFRDGSPSASWGIVSNLRRRAPSPLTEVERARLTLHQYGTLIQTDAATQLGCSGGALLNLQGELVGVTTALAALNGVETPGGYAVPLGPALKKVVDVLRKGEEVEYGFLGVNLSDETRAARGAVLASVTPGSPARAAGLQRGDVIVGINGRPVRDQDDLFLLIGGQLTGSTAQIEYDRRGGGGTVNATLAKYFVPGPCIASKRPEARGGLRVDHASVVVQPASFALWGQSIPDGVVIREVTPGSAADRARLQPGKVINRVNGKFVKSPQDYHREMGAARGKVELNVLSAEGREEKVTLDLN